MPRETFEAMVARIVEYVHAGDAFQVVPSQRWSADARRRPVLDLPRAARRQPVPVHVLPRLRRLPGRRREPRAAAHGHRPRRLDAADRRHAPARRDAAEDARDRRRAAGRREGARRARDARRPRAQRPRPRLRVRQRRRSTTFMAVETYSHVMHIVSSVVGHAARGRRRDGRAALASCPAGTLSRRAEGPRDADHRRARARQARRLRRRDRLPELHRRPRHLHPHPHRRRQGRRRPRPGRRRHRRRRQARLRVRGVGGEGARRAARDRARPREQPDWP